MARLARYMLFSLVASSIAFAAVISQAVAWAVDAFLDAIAGPERPLDLGLFPVLSTGNGAPIDAALYQGNRHEAGVSRRSAARNT